MRQVYNESHDESFTRCCALFSDGFQSTPIVRNARFIDAVHERKPFCLYRESERCDLEETKATCRYPGEGTSDAADVIVRCDATNRENRAVSHD